MKLNKDNFEKIIDGDLTIYKYNCNDTNFFLELVGNNENRNINIFKGSFNDRQELKTTKDSLEAWNYFEILLVACQSEQGYSGGDIKNPQENPNLLPLLAIGSVDGDGFINITLFVVLDDKKQKKAFDFKVSVDTMPQPLPDVVFEVDWSGEDITQFLKAEVLLKRFEDIKFEEDPDKKVFLFIPKSLITQGGEEGGNTEEGEKGKPSEEKGKPSEDKGENGKPTDKEGEPKDDEPKSDEPPSGINGKPTDKEGEPKDDEPKSDEPPSGVNGKPTDKEGEPKDDEPKSDEPPSGVNGKPTDKEGDKEDRQSGKGQTGKMNFSDTIQKLSKSTNKNPSSIIGFFRSVGSGESWLSLNNFSKIKNDLGLPTNMTTRELSEIIINSK